MLKLSAFAKSTFGELKESLLDADSDDDDESPSQVKASAAHAIASLPGDALEWPPGWPGATSSVIGNGTSASTLKGYPATPERPAVIEHASPVPLGVETPEQAKGALAAADSPEVSNGHRAGPATPIVESSRQSAVSAESPEPRPTEQLREVELKTESTNGRHDLLSSFSERYESLLAEYNSLQRRFHELSERSDRSDVLGQQVEAWRSAQQVAQERVEVLTLENADLKEKVLKLERGGMDADEKKKLLQVIHQRDSQVKAADEALRQLTEVIEDDAGDSKVRCRQLEAELSVARQSAVEADAKLAEAANGTRDALAAAEAAEARRQAAEARCKAIEADTAGTAEALEALLREKEQRMEEQPHLVDRRLVTCMLANYLDHLQHSQKGLADAALSQTLQILGGLPDLEARHRIRKEAEPKDALGQAFLEFLDQETAQDS